MKMEPWDEPKKKEDAEPENEVSNEVPQQGEEKPGPVDLKKVRQKIKRAVGNKALHMVQKILDEDGTLGYLAMKYLFDIAGLFPTGGAEDAEQEDSLAKILLRRLGLEDEIKTGSEVTKETQASAPVEQKDAVK
jgi:hypothetical protein